MKKLTICLAIAGALALPATAGAAEQFFGGKIDNGGTIGIDVTTQGGDPFQVNAMRYKNFPMNCSILGPATADGTWTFTNFLVINDKFNFNGDASNGDHLEWKGTFTNGGKKIDPGKLKAGPLDGGAGVGECTSARRNYSAKRGAKGPHPKMNAKVHRAFRVAR